MEGGGGASSEERTEDAFLRYALFRAPPRDGPAPPGWCPDFLRVPGYPRYARRTGDADKSACKRLSRGRYRYELDRRRGANSREVAWLAGFVGGGVTVVNTPSACAAAPPP